MERPGPQANPRGTMSDAANLFEISGGGGNAPQTFNDAVAGAYDDPGDTYEGPGGALYQGPYDPDVVAAADEGGAAFEGAPGGEDSDSFDLPLSIEEALSSPAWMAEIGGLIEDNPELSNPDNLNSLFEAAAAHAQALGRPELAYDPATLEVFHNLAVAGMREAQQQQQQRQPAPGPQHAVNPRLAGLDPIAQSIAGARGARTAASEFWGWVA